MAGSTLLWGLLALMFAVGAGSWWFWKHGGAFECVDSIKDELPSPDGKYVATRWERTCGADRAIHVSLKEIGKPPEGDVDDVRVFKKRIGVRFYWMGARELAVDYPVLTTEAPVHRQRWRDVKISSGAWSVGSPCRTGAQCSNNEICRTLDVPMDPGPEHHVELPKRTCEPLCDPPVACAPGFACIATSGLCRSIEPL